jgi:hypothetical protein
LTKEQVRDLEENDPSSGARTLKSTPSDLDFSQRFLISLGVKDPEKLVWFWKHPGGKKLNYPPDPSGKDWK